jgi:hypothetical protein
VQPALNGVMVARRCLFLSRTVQYGLYEIEAVAGSSVRYAMSVAVNAAIASVGTDASFALTDEEEVRMRAEDWAYFDRLALEIRDDPGRRERRLLDLRDCALPANAWINDPANAWARDALKK